MISARKAKQLDATTMFTYSHANTPLGQSERAYYLSYFISYSEFTTAVGLLQITTTFITIYDSLLITILDSCYYNLGRCLLQFTTDITIYDRTHVTFSFSVKITDASKRSIKNLIEAISWRI